MEEKPYKFDSKNPRLVTNIKQDEKIPYYAGLFFLASMQLYRRKVYRLNGNIINFAFFTGASVWCSYAYANYFFSSPIIEAGIMNNEREALLLK